MKGSVKSLNQYIENIKQIELFVTYACNSRCRHCVTVNQSREKKIQERPAAELVKNMAHALDIQSVITLGGEPLLHPEAVCAIHQAAEGAGVPNRKLVTNGGLQDEPDEVEKQADFILSCGINQALLSVDTFHMEFIPLTRQYAFARALKEKGFPDLRLNPMWMVSREDGNIFNMETEECLKTFRDLGIPIIEGNVAIPEGNARRYLERFYTKGAFCRGFRCGDALGTQRLDCPSAIGVEPWGDVTVCGFSIGNMYETNIMAILERYDPYQDPRMAALLAGGILSLQRYADEKGLGVNLLDCFTPCEFCRRVKRLQREADGG